jgi:hypothetical protein
VADVNHVITLGIGTPADIPHFILVGLSPTGAVAVIDPEPIVIEVQAAGRIVTVDRGGRIVHVPISDRIVEIGAKP